MLYNETMQKFLTFSFVLYLFMFNVGASYAEDPTPAPTDDPRKTELENKIKDLQGKLNETSKQKNTLSAQITYMDNQVYLTELKMQETEKRVEDTAKEIDILGNRIEGLDSSLDNLSKQLIKRVVDGYKRKNVTVFDMVLNSGNANDLLSRMKYYKTAQANNQKILVQVQETKSNFEEQRSLREKKKVELDNLKNTLVTQKSTLIQQQSAKKQLLEVTKNDEAVYQRQIEEARKQIESFKSFVQSTGANVIGANAFGGGEGGWYMSQRDSRWAGMRMGDSPESILDVGCFITSIAMIMKFYGADYTPATIASNPKYFAGGSGSACFPNSYPSAYACSPANFNGSWAGKSYHNISYSQIDSYLSKNVPIVAGVRGSSHYIVLKKGSGGNYIMNDPIYGPDKNVSDYYSISGPLGVFE